LIYPGSLQFLYFDDLSGGAKVKICLTVCADPNMFFLVNSRVSQFIQRRKELNDCQVLIDRENHDFILTRDSYLDCTDAYGIHEDEVRLQLRHESRHPKGNASIEIITQAIAAVEVSPKLTPRVQILILDSLKPLAEHVGS
jgi:hypothetical protein